MYSRVLKKDATNTSKYCTQMTRAVNSNNLTFMQILEY